MPKKRVLSPKSVWDEAQLRTAFAEASVKEHHVPRLYKHLLRDPAVEWSAIQDLPKAACELLDRDFVRFSSTVEQCQTSGDGTRKLLIRLQDGLSVEAVLMQYDTTGLRQNDEEDEAEATVHGRRRSTLCVSSEVGCQMGCTFCATGTMGLVGDLTAGEIIEQAVHALQELPYRNVVFMGMGEPLNNYAAVKAAVAMLTDSRVFALRRNKVTVSTVGVVPRVLQLSEDLPGVSLAVSLHAPTQELRQTIVPSAKAYPLHKLMAALTTYQDRTDQKIFIEYVMLAHVNDNPEQAHQLGRLLQGRNYMVNLIPWNPIYSPTINFQAPGEERLVAFHDIVRNTYGLHCTIRQEKGSDIAGACGQLVIQSQDKKGCVSDKPVKDIEELGGRRGQQAVPAA